MRDGRQVEKPSEARIAQSTKIRSDPYSTERARLAGLTVEEHLAVLRFKGSADCLIAADLIEADRLPAGRKRQTRWQDASENSLYLRKAGPGVYELNVVFSIEYRDWRRKRSEVRTLVESLPTSEESFREHLRGFAHRVIATVIARQLDQYHGGYKLDASEDELLALFAPWIDAIESLPVKYSPQERARQIVQCQADANVLDPDYIRFRDALLSACPGMR